MEEANEVIGFGSPWRERSRLERQRSVAAGPTPSLLKSARGLQGRLSWQNPWPCLAHMVDGEHVNRRLAIGQADWRVGSSESR